MFRVEKDYQVKFLCSVTKLYLVEILHLQILTLAFMSPSDIYEKEPMSQNFMILTP